MQPAGLFFQKTMVLRGHGFKVVKQSELHMDFIGSIFVFIGNRGAALPTKHACDTVIGDEAIWRRSGEIDLVEFKSREGRHH